VNGERLKPGIIEIGDGHEILQYLHTVMRFEKDLLVAETRGVTYQKCNLRNLNIFSHEMSLSPKEKEIRLEMEVGSDIIVMDGPGGRIKFETEMTKGFVGRLINLKIPHRIIIKNERAFNRFRLDTKERIDFLVFNESFHSYDRNFPDVDGSVIDVSPTGFGLKIPPSAQKFFFSGDLVNFTLDKDLEFLKNLKGRVRYKAFVPQYKNTEAFIKLGVELENELPWLQAGQHFGL
jgi:hypothetical protein